MPTASALAQLTTISFPPLGGLCRNGFLASVCSLLALMPMSTFLYMDLCTIAAYGMGWVGAWNLLDMASYILQVCVCVRGGACSQFTVGCCHWLEWQGA